MVPDAPLPLEPRDYENWSRMIRVTGVPTATPQTDDEALGLVRWAAREGYRVRVYLPYGTQWYPYLTRRMAERPANLLLFLRSVIGS